MASNAGIGLAAARILQRRFKGRDRYRKRRDRKIAVDLLGRTYYFDGNLFRLYSYNVDRHTIRMALLDGTQHVTGSTQEWDTDTFWKRLRKGEMIDA